MNFSTRAEAALAIDGRASVAADADASVAADVARSRRLVGRDKEKVGMGGSFYKLAGA
jgi:hypothetical protein